MATPPSSPGSSGPVSPSFPPHPDDLPENNLLSSARAKATRAWNATKGYFTSIFPSRSASLIDSAIRQPGVSIVSPPPRSSTPPVPPADSDSDEDPIDSSASDSVEESESTGPANRAEIGGVLMEFTVKINGKDTPLSPALLAQLQPIFDELAKTPEGQTKLKTGFTCTIRFGDLHNIKFYHNGIEILKGASEDLFKQRQDLFQHMEDFKKLFEQNELDLGYASDVNEKAPIVTAPEDFLIPASRDGNCLLHAAAYHIKKKRPPRPNQDLTPEALRRAIAEKAQEELDRNAPGNWIKFIAQDIDGAREFALNNDLVLTDPFTQLFNEGIEDAVANAISGSPSDAELLVNTYKAYVLDRATPTSLDSYAIHYLNETYFEGKLLVVRKEGTNFTPIEVDTPIPTINLTNNDKLSIPVIVYNGKDHYDAIDSSDPRFWAAYRPNP